MYNCHLDTQPGDLGPFKGCYSVTSTERSFSPRSKKRLETSKHPLNGGSGIFLFELIGINRGMIQNVGHNLSPKIKQVGYADESHIKLRGERDVIGLRNPTEYKRAFRRMLTSADLHKAPQQPALFFLFFDVSSFFDSLLSLYNKVAMEQKYQWLKRLSSH